MKTERIVLSTNGYHDPDPVTLWKEPRVGRLTHTKLLAVLLSLAAIGWLLYQERLGEKEEAAG